MCWDIYLLLFHHSLKMADVKSTSLCWIGFSLNNMARVIIYGVYGAWYAQEGELTTFHTGLGSRHWPGHWQGIAWQQLRARLHLGAGRVLVQERQCTARRACSAQTRVRWSDLAWGRTVHPSRGEFGYALEYEQLPLDFQAFYVRKMLLSFLTLTQNLLLEPKMNSEIYMGNIYSNEMFTLLTKLNK